MRKRIESFQVHPGERKTLVKQTLKLVLGLRWVGVFSDEKIQPRKTPLDTLCAVLESRCAYEPDERDMVMLQHKFEM